MVYSESSKKAVLKYKKTHYKRIALEMKTEEHEKLKNAASRTGESINGYVRESIRQRIQRESPEDPEE